MPKCESIQSKLFFRGGGVIEWFALKTKEFWILDVYHNSLPNYVNAIEWGMLKTKKSWDLLIDFYVAVPTIYQQLSTGKANLPKDSVVLFISKTTALASSSTSLTVKLSWEHKSSPSLRSEHSAAIFSGQRHLDSTFNSLQRNFQLTYQSHSTGHVLKTR